MRFSIALHVANRLYGFSVELARLEAESESWPDSRELAHMVREEFIQSIRLNGSDAQHYFGDKTA